MGRAEVPPVISVVIPTHNRRESLLRALDALTRQTIDPRSFEVIVALDATTDGSSEAIQTRCWPMKITQVVSEHRGAAANRNAGATVARSARLIFLDDDIIADPGFLAAHLAAAAETSGAVVVGQSAPVVSGQGWFHQALSDWWRELFAEMQAPEHRFTYQDLTSGNFSIDRDLFVDMGGFDASFGTGAREDYELGYRLMQRGVPFRHARAARGLHHDASDLTKSLGRAKGEGIGDVVMLRKHPALFRWVRVSHLAANTSGARLLRGLVYHVPAVGRLVRWLAAGAMPLLEALGWRGLWTKASLVARSLNYFEGVALATGTPAGLQSLTDLARSATVVPNSLRFDVGNGFKAMADAVDKARPAEVCLFDGGQMIAFWPPMPGAEPLAARHLQSQSAALSGRRRLLLAARHLLPPWPQTDPEGITNVVDITRPWPISLGVIDVESWAFTARDTNPGYPMRLMLRAGQTPLGWLCLITPDAEGRFWPAVRNAIFADAAILRHLIAACGLPKTLPADPPGISVVICTRDRTDTLRRCLAAVMALDYPNFEIIVVDNAPASEATRDLVARMPALRYVREDRPGLDWARNCGVAAARHEIIAFTDDDTEADRHWLSGIARGLADPSISAVTGLVAPMALNTEAQVYFEDVYGGMGKGFDPAIKDRADLGGKGVLWASGFGVGANMAFRKTALAQTGGFDPALDVGTATRGGGDIEMFHRIVAAGLRLAYEPSAFVWHEHRADWGALEHQLRDNGSGFAAYLLTAARNRSVPRREILLFTLRDWIYGWLIKRWLRPGKHKRQLIRAEFRGLMKGYASYRQARHRAVELEKPKGSEGRKA